MRTGGASTSGLSSHKRIYTEHLKAYRKNGVRSNFFLEGIRYAWKVGEIVVDKFHPQRDYPFPPDCNHSCITINGDIRIRNSYFYKVGLGRI